MKLNKMKKEDLELMSYTKIAEEILKEEKTKMNTAELFKKICTLLELSDNEYEEKIADFFQSLTTAKEFILLEDGNWDLKMNHSTKVSINDILEDDEEDLDTTEENTDENEEESLETLEEEDFDAIDDDYEEDDLNDLSIINEDEMEE